MVNRFVCQRDPARKWAEKIDVRSDSYADPHRVAPDRLEAKDMSMDHTDVRTGLLAGQTISATPPVLTTTP